MRRLLAALCLAVLLAPIARAREPLTVPDIPDFYQRVLTLPEARLSKAPGEAASGAALPIFSVLYVYDRKDVGADHWVQVGAKPAGSGDGWLPAARTQEWRSMLVMQYAPRSVRARAMVFGTRDQLEALVTDQQGTEQAKALEAKLASGAAQGTGLVAAEPTEPVDYSKRPYVMPILDWKLGRFPGDRPVLLLDLASATAGATDTAGRVKPLPPPVPPPRPADMKIAVTFLLDTTKSMQPYLDRVRDALTKLHDQLKADGTLDKVRFGIVAYRNTTALNPRVEYVTKVFENLDPRASPDDVLKALAQVSESPVETPGWDEDGYAGMYDALNQLDWTPYAARFLVSVSDSGPLGAHSKYVKYANIDLENIVELANRKHVAFFPVQLLTPEGNKYPGLRTRAASIYRTLGSQTGDPSVSKYTAIPAGSVDTFAAAMTGLTDTIRAAVRGAQVQPEPVPASAALAPADPQASLRQAVVNEIFRTQLEFIGSQKGELAPGFVQGWTADRDLTQPNLRSLDVKVFLTRNQLNGLAQSLSRIVESAKQASLSQDTFFDLLRSLSATMAGDPNRQPASGSFVNLADSNLLPSYLKALPYRSKVLRMSRDTWLNAGMTGQQLWIDELEYKLKQYQDMYGDSRAWIDFGSGEPGDAVYPVPLDTLP